MAIRFVEPIAIESTGRAELCVSRTQSDQTLRHQAMVDSGFDEDLALGEVA